LRFEPGYNYVYFWLCEKVSGEG